MIIQIHVIILRTKIGWFVFVQLSLVVLIAIGRREPLGGGHSFVQAAFFEAFRTLSKMERFP